MGAASFLLSERATQGKGYMTTDAAVIDAPGTTETKAEPSPETKAPDTGTDGQEAAVQTETPDATGAEEESKPENAEDHAAELAREKAEADEARLKEEARKLAQEEREREVREAKEQKRKADIRNARQTAIDGMKRLTDELAQTDLRDAQGNKLNLQSKNFMDVVEKLALNVEPSVREEVAEQYQESFNEVLGEASEAFWKDAQQFAGEDGNIPVAALINLAVEHRAKDAKSIREMDLDDLVKLSPKARQQYVKAKNDEYEKGRENPLPAGEPRGSNGSGISARVHYTTKAEARTLHVNGQISNAEMRRINADPTLPEGL